MPQRKEPFENGEIYHITMRRMGDELLFADLDDHYRGIFSIYEFNTSELVTIRQRRLARVQFKKLLRANSGPTTAIDSRDLLVKILAFCFMPNHIHLLLQQIKNWGISKFMQKFGSGFSRYHKDKYPQEKRGHFFQEKFGAVHMGTEEQLKNVFVYIHTNPIDIIEPHWKEKGIKNPEKAIKFLEEEYRWSSYWDYIGKKNFPSVTERNFLLEIMGGEQSCRNFVADWIRYKGEIREFAELALE